MTPEELARLKALCEAASPAPWHIGHIDEEWLYPLMDVDDADGANVGENIYSSNAPFIAAARTAMPLLIAEVERLSSENADLHLTCKIMSELERF